MKKHKKHISIDEKFRKLIPPVFFELNELLQKEDVSIAEVARTIEKDVIITTKVIRLANAPFYGFPGRIGSVEDALIILGLNTVKIMLYTICVVNVMENHYNDLCNHSIKVGEIAKNIAERIDLPKVSEIYTAGLLHDFGKIVIKVCTSEYENIKNKALKENRPFWQVEQEILGLDHTSVAKQLLEEWMFPERIIEIVSNHHTISKSKKFSKETALIHLADALVNAGSLDKVEEFPGFDENTFKILEMDKENLKEIVSEIL